MRQPLLYASREYDWHQQLLAAWDTIQDLRQITASGDAETETNCPYCGGSWNQHLSYCPLYKI